MKTLTFQDQFQAPAPPERVFPLLCPIREYDWLDGWRCTLLHSESGVAERDCVFRTEGQGEGPMTWVVSRYEPPLRIEFTCLVPDALVMRLDISVKKSGAGASLLEWSRRFVSLGERGDLMLGEREAGHASVMARIEGALVHYLETGSILRGAAPAR